MKLSPQKDRRNQYQARLTHMATTTTTTTGRLCLIYFSRTLRHAEEVSKWREREREREIGVWLLKAFLLFLKAG